MAQQPAPYVDIPGFLRNNRAIEAKTAKKQSAPLPVIKPKEMVDRVAEFILDLKNETLARIRIKDICKKFQLNASFLSRKFKQERETCLCEFIQQVKIQRAILLLQQDQVQRVVGMNGVRGKLSINLLAQHLGYSSTEYFIRCFKKRMGVSPHKYRRYLYQDYGCITSITAKA